MASGRALSSLADTGGETPGRNIGRESPGETPGDLPDKAKTVGKKSFLSPTVYYFLGILVLFFLLFFLFSFLFSSFGPGSGGAGGSPPSRASQGDQNKKPESRQSESRQSESRQPEIRQPESRQPESRQSESRQPESRQPEIRQPETNRPEIRQPETNRPEIRRPETTPPELNRPDEKKSKGEKICCQVLEEIYGVPFTTQRPNFLRNPKTGRNLEIDCYNHQLKIGVEYQGRQHYEFPNNYHRDEEVFINQVDRDLMKVKMCQREGVHLIAVPYHVPLKDIRGYIVERLPRDQVCKVPQ